MIVARPGRRGIGADAEGGSPSDEPAREDSPRRRRRRRSRGPAAARSARGRRRR
jgi:hypothetical protein